MLCKLQVDITKTGLTEEEFLSVLTKSSFSGLMKEIISESSQWSKEVM